MMNTHVLLVMLSCIYYTHANSLFFKPNFEQFTAPQPCCVPKQWEGIVVSINDPSMHGPHDEEMDSDETEGYLIHEGDDYADKHHIPHPRPHRQKKIVSFHIQLSIISYDIDKIDIRLRRVHYY